MTNKPSSYLPILQTAAYNAGNEILNVYKDPNFATEFKSDSSPLTEADKRAHVAIMQELEKTNLPILSEEGQQMEYEVRKNWDAFWLVDPLDGTKEFVKRNGEFTVNIALIENGIATFGIVYAPVLDKCWYGGLEFGAFVLIDFARQFEQEILMPLPIKSNSSLRPYTVVGSRSHASPETEVYITELRKKYGELDFVSMGSSLKLCVVAEGKANAYPRFAPTMEWDTAAGHAVASAAGCRVDNAMESKPLTYNKENLLNPWFIVEAIE